MIASDYPTLLGGAIDGLGLAQLPGPVAAAALRAGTLVELLEPLAPMAPGVFLYFSDRRQMRPNSGPSSTM